MNECGFATLRIPLGGRATYVVGLGALLNKCGFATLLIPLGGRTTYVVGLGALIGKWGSATLLISLGGRRQRRLGALISHQNGLTTTNTTIAANSSTADSLNTRSQRSLRVFFICSNDRNSRAQRW
jgi:hypothetical protein